MRGFAFAFLAALALGAPAAQAQQGMAPMMRPEGTLLSVSADAEVQARPDTATINVGVTTRADSAARAMADNSGRMKAVIAALRKSGVAEKDIQTSGLSLNPQYQYNQNEPPQLTGYEATDTVTAKILRLANVGDAIDAVVAVGSNQIAGVSFSIADPDPLLDQARREAFKKARARADLYAAAAGMKVARILSIREGGASSPRPIYPVAMARAEAATPVAPGELTLSASVNATFELR